jgi:hypothetical protein
MLICTKAKVATHTSELQRNDGGPVCDALLILWFDFARCIPTLHSMYNNRKGLMKVIIAINQRDIFCLYDRRPAVPANIIIPAPAALAAPPVNSGTLVRVEVTLVPTEDAASEVEARREARTEEVEVRLKVRLENSTLELKVPVQTWELKNECSKHE